MEPKSDKNTNRVQEELRPAEKAQAQRTEMEISDSRSKPKRRSGWKSGIASGEDWWVWELVGLVTSAAALVCIFVLLQKYDDKEQPNWKHLSLNTAVSFIGVVAKAGVLAATSRGIGQLKWIWLLNTERSLADLQMYDAASRSISGCILLLVKFKTSYLASFGSIGIILALGFDPFLQNLVRTYSRPSISATQIAYLSNSTLYNALGPNAAADIYYVDPAMKANLYGSILNVETNKQWSVPAFSCSTGNCTWGPIATLAARPLCSDITFMLETSCGTFTGNHTIIQEPPEQCNVSLKDSQILTFMNDETRYRTSMDLSSAGIGSDRLPIVYNNQTFPVVRYVSAIGNGIGLPRTSPEPVNTQTKFVATECAIEPYVASIQARVKENVYSEVVLEEWTGWQNSSGVNADATMDIVFTPPWDAQQGIEPGQNFTITSKARGAIELFMLYMFDGSFLTMQPTGDGTGITTGSTTGGTRIVGNNEAYYPVAETILSLISNNYTSHTNNSDDKLSGLMQNVAQAMKKSLRDASYIANGGVANETAQMAAGKTLVAVTFISVQWPWLILPVVVWVLAFMTWAGTAWKTRRLGIMSWGNSILPLLFLYREEHIAKGGVSSLRNENCVSCEEYMQRAEATRVKLWVSGGAAGLSEQ